MEDFKESIQLAPGVYLEASPHKFRLHRRLPWEPSPCVEVLMPAGNIDVTRQMMAGAYYAGLSSGKAGKDNMGNAAAASLLGHIHSLASSYQTTHATPPTMRRAADRLAACGQPEVAEYCRHVAAEESGHDTLALMDLNALGLPAAVLVERLRPKNALALVALFTQFADSNEPIAVLGYAYTLERMALLNTEASITAIEQHIPRNVNASRCLRVHSAVGSDTDHVAASLEFIATLTSQQRAIIVGAVYTSTSLLSAASTDYPGDDAMQALLDEFSWSMPEALLT
jgi:hypothetical protein